MTMKEIWVDKDDYRKTKLIEVDMPVLADGDVLVSVDKFGLTANNVSYAVSGKAIGYWGYYPADNNWGKVPVADMAQHRQNLPLFYNQYQRTEAEPDYLKTLEDERCLLFPLFATSFVLNDVDFVKALKCCDQIVVYGDEAQIDTEKPSAFVDMSGNGELVKTLHDHLQDNMVHRQSRIDRRTPRGRPNLERHA